MFRYLLLSLLVANMFWKNVDGCKTSDGCIPGAIPGINLCPNNRVRRVASFDDIISELKTLEKAGGEYWIQKSKNMSKGLNALNKQVGNKKSCRNITAA